MSKQDPAPETATDRPPIKEVPPGEPPDRLPDLMGTQEPPPDTANEHTPTRDVAQDEPPDPRLDPLGYELYLERQGDPEARRSLFDRAISELCATWGIADLRLRMLAVLEMTKHLDSMPSGSGRPPEDTERLEIAMAVVRIMQAQGSDDWEAACEALEHRGPDGVFSPRRPERNRQNLAVKRQKKGKPPVKDIRERFTYERIVAAYREFGDVAKRLLAKPPVADPTNEG